MGVDAQVRAGQEGVDGSWGTAAEADDETTGERTKGFRLLFIPCPRICLLRVSSRSLAGGGIYSQNIARV